MDILTVGEKINAVFVSFSGGNKVRVRLGYNAGNDRYGFLVSDLWENSSFQCGECLEVLVGNQWVATRMKMDWDNGGWYLAGTPYHGDLEYVQAKI